MADLSTLQTWLTEAEQAYHNLQIGERVAIAVVNGRRTEYTPAKMGELRRYIAELKDKIAKLSGTSRRGPIEFKL